MRDLIKKLEEVKAKPKLCADPIMDDGKIVAQVCTGGGGPPEGLDRYTAYVKWPGKDGDVEEIDVDATTKALATKMAETEAKETYQPGGKVVKVVKREGLYM